MISCPAGRVGSSTERSEVVNGLGILGVIMFHKLASKDLDLWPDKLRVYSLRHG